ncbi:MAG: hypothetical protein P9X26_08395 [Candidatus Stygibacter frigidus]|nr:hypothetical protein [Candidatus Stygibacter frigidus]
MRFTPARWISNFSGYCDGLIFMTHQERYRVMASRDYVYPSEITSQNVVFGNIAKAVSGTWDAAAEGFVADMATYQNAWDTTQQEGREPEWEVFSYPLFIKACYAAAKITSFDLSTLTVDTFGGEASDLLGTEAPNVGNLIEAAGMPACGLDLSDLNSSIESV